MRQREETLNQQRRAHQENERERDFGHDKHLPDPVLSATGTHARTTVTLDGLGERKPRGPEGWRTQYAIPLSTERPNAKSHTGASIAITVSGGNAARRPVVGMADFITASTA